MNDLVLRLEVVLRVNHCVTFAIEYRRTLDIEAFMTTNRKWPKGNQMAAWPITSCDPERSNSYPNTLRAQCLENSWRCYHATI